jgi:hypothetical protein
MECLDRAPNRREEFAAIEVVEDESVGRRSAGRGCSNTVSARPPVRRTIGTTPQR